MQSLTQPFDQQTLHTVTPPDFPTLIGGQWPAGRSYPPEQVTQNALQLIRDSAQGAPMLLRASYLQPHTPVYPPEELLDRIRKFPPPEFQLDQVGPSAFEQRFAENLGSKHMSRADAEYAWHCYMALVHWVDLQVGILLGELKRLGMEEETLVLFTADHGAALGEDGLWAKQNFRRFSHQVPLLLRGPGVAATSLQQGLSDSTDIGPTLAAWAGLSLDERLDGIDLLAEGESRDALISMIGYGQADSFQFPNRRYGRYVDDKGWPRRACVRTRDWRYERNVLLDGEPLSAAVPYADACLIHASDLKEHMNVLSDQVELADELEELLLHAVKQMI